MKKILNYFGIITLCAVLFSSCELNEMPKFDDKDAFVAFGSSSVSVSEDCGSVKIPVTLASLSGVSSSVTVVANDGTAASGKNYELVTSSLSFTESAPTQYVEIKIVNLAGEFTGDLNFSLAFSSTGDVKAGMENTCSVTIKDNDHPLTPILGAYTATGTSYWYGAMKWTMTFKKDANDISKVWVDNFFCNDDWTGDDMLLYGVVDSDLTTITMPFGQTSEYVYSNGEAVIFYGVDADLNAYDNGEGNWTITIKDGGAKMSVDYGVWAYIPGAGNLSIMLPGFELVKN